MGLTLSSFILYSLKYLSYTFKEQFSALLPFFYLFFYCFIYFLLVYVMYFSSILFGPCYTLFLLSFALSCDFPRQHHLQFTVLNLFPFFSIHPVIHPSIHPSTSFCRSLRILASCLVVLSCLSCCN